MFFKRSTNSRKKHFFVHIKLVISKPTKRNKYILVLFKRYWIVRKVISFFSYRYMLLVWLSSQLYSKPENHYYRLTMHITNFIFKKLFWMKFVNLSSPFCLAPHQKWKNKGSIFGIFCFIFTIKVKIQCKQEKNCVPCMERCVDWTPVPELVLEILFWEFWSQRCITFWKANWDEIKALVETNCRITTREIAKLNLSNSTVHEHLKKTWFYFKARCRWIITKYVRIYYLFLI